MTYIKKLVVKGFKSFVPKTEIPFSHGINIVLGPNGSGKSNIADALCFVLGRLSIKSMRAAKASNLIFLGNKQLPPGKEAVVEITFDNTNKTFSLERQEITIKRIVRTNGQSIYKINDETKTRQEILELLSHAGIDPNGFNIIQQGEIQGFVRMHSEDRRKIIEEVSGISIYELRKEKTLHELEKTEEKLKEVQAILRERTSYLNNLEKERQQALKFRELQNASKKFKASIISHDLILKKRELNSINEDIEKKNHSLNKLKKVSEQYRKEILDIETKITQINSLIQQATGFEQEKLNHEIADLRADLAGLKVKSENYEKRLKETVEKREELKTSILESQKEIEMLRKKSPVMKKTQDDLERRKKELIQVENDRKKFYTVKSELKSLRDRLQDKISLLKSLETESDILLKQIDQIYSTFHRKETKNIKEIIEKLKKNLEEKNKDSENLDKKERDLEKNLLRDEFEIQKLKKTKIDIAKLDICPLCKSKITREHIEDIDKEISPRINELEKNISNFRNHLSETINKREVVKNEINLISEDILKAEADSLKIKNIEEKKDQIKYSQEKIENLRKEINEFEKIKNNLEQNVEKFSTIEQKYETLRIEVNELILRTEENLDSEITFKQRELERVKVAINQLDRDEEIIEEDLGDISKEIDQKEYILEKKEAQDEELSKRFKKLFEERDSLQDKIHEIESLNLKNQNEIHKFDQESNELKIQRAKLNAEYENLDIEFQQFPGIQVIKTGKEILIEKLNKIQETLNKIGNVNLRALEVYDSVKKEYDAVQERVNILEKEKEKILDIIHEIDIKKKKTFNKTLDAINTLFSRNFMQLSTKGYVFLEVENKQEPFQGGVNILVKTGKGKYFDVTSLSGGEQTIVALSLIFAIQEYKPYSFYILDEIDAALDKRNSERLAELLKKYMQSGQYIIITHNDEVINKATNIYGVSMHDGVSKIISLKL